MAQLCQLSAIGFLRKITAEIYFFKNRTKAKTNKKHIAATRTKISLKQRKLWKRKAPYMFLKSGSQK